MAARAGKRRRISTTSKTKAGVESGAPLAAAKNLTTFQTDEQQNMETSCEEDRESDSPSDLDDDMIEDIFADIPLPPDNIKDQDYVGDTFSSPKSPGASRVGSTAVPATRSRRR